MGNTSPVGHGWIHTGTHEISFMRCVKERVKRAEEKRERNNVPNKDAEREEDDGWNGRRQGTMRWTNLLRFRNNRFHAP